MRIDGGCLGCHTRLRAPCVPFPQAISTSHVQAKPADHQRPSYHCIAQAFARVGLPPPPKARYTTITGHPLTTYFQGGVLVFPAALLTPVLHAWLAAYHVLARQPNWAPMKFRRSIDQVAFAAAVAQTTVPFRVLPLALNFPPSVVIEEVVPPSLRLPLLLPHCAPDPATKVAINSVSWGIWSKAFVCPWGHTVGAGPFTGHVLCPYGSVLCHICHISHVHRTYLIPPPAPS